MAMMDKYTRRRDQAFRIAQAAPPARRFALHALIGKALAEGMRLAEFRERAAALLAGMRES
jgi:hypothetical protein